MSRPAESNHRHQSDTDCEKRRQVDGKCHQSEEHSGSYLCEYDEKFPCLVEFKHRAPEKLDGPRPHNQRGPKSDLRIRYSQIFEHHGRHHIQHDKGQSHSEIECGNPSDWRFQFLCGHHYVVNEKNLILYKTIERGIITYFPKHFRLFLSVFPKLVLRIQIIMIFLQSIVITRVYGEDGFISRVS